MKNGKILSVCGGGRCRSVSGCLLSPDTREEAGITGQALLGAVIPLSTPLAENGSDLPPWAAGGQTYAAAAPGSGENSARRHAPYHIRRCMREAAA